MEFNELSDFECRLKLLLPLSVRVDRPNINDKIVLNIIKAWDEDWVKCLFELYRSKETNFYSSHHDIYR